MTQNGEPSIEGVELGADPTELYRWAADGRVAEAARQRLRRRLMRQQLTEETTLRGALLDFGEQQSVITVTTTDGRKLVGSVITVGTDYVEVALNETPVTAVIALAGVTAVAGHTSTASGERQPASAQSMYDLIFGWAAERPWIAVMTRASMEPFSGVLRSVGRDVLALQESDHDVATTYLHLCEIISLSRMG